MTKGCRSVAATGTALCAQIMNLASNTVWPFSRRAVSTRIQAGSIVLRRLLSYARFRVHTPNTPAVVTLGLASDGETRAGAPYSA